MRSVHNAVLPTRSGFRLPFFLLALALATVISDESHSIYAQGGGRSASKFYPDSSDTAETLLRNAASHARDRQWSEAIDIFQRVIDQYGDKVARVPRDEEGVDPSGDFVLFVDLRRFCQSQLAKLPAEARAVYRKRMDSQAEGWFKQGESQRDPAPLRRVVEYAFCSSWGDNALELLGDLTFQEGRFGDALAMYRRLVPDRLNDGMALVHPDPDVDLARVAAKKLLCRAAQGEAVPGVAEIEEFSRQFPQASGNLAGRKGAYVDILKKALVSDRLAPPTQPDSRWPTFAGALTRTKVVPNPIDVGSLQWRVDLERYNPRSVYTAYPRPSNSTTPASLEKLLIYHPIVVGDQVVVSDGIRVLAYNLNDRPLGMEGGEGASRGVELAWKHDPENGASVPQAHRQFGGIPRHTLTAVGSRIYARMGPSTPPYFVGGMRPALGMGGGASSYIIALDWNAQGRLIWVQKSQELTLPNRPNDRNNRFVSFEGTPVADARNVYVAVTDRREQTATYVMCFDAETGASRWTRYLGAASSEVDNFMAMGMNMGGPAATDYGHRLLSLDGPTLYYQTNLGSVIALDTETGSVRWVATYPRRDATRVSQNDRDLNPAIVAQGMVIVAPDDASAIFAFDEDTGRLIWKSETIPDDLKLTHLLGVTQGRLIATGDRVVLFDLKTGKQVQAWPDSGNKSFDGFGRGLLAGDKIYWPTRNEIHVLDQRTGQRTDPPIKLQETFRTSGGNLVAGDGYLIVAQPDGLVVFCQNSRLIERYQQEIAMFPQRAGAHYRLAQAAEALGRDSLALESYENAAARSRPDEQIDGIAISDLAKDHEHRLLSRLAQQARQEKEWGRAAGFLERATKIAHGDSERLKAQLQLAQVYNDAGRIQDSLVILNRVLADERLRPLSVISDDGNRTMRADLLVADRLSSIVSREGREVYAPFEKQATDLLGRAKKTGDPRLFEDVHRLYPIASVVSEADWELGRLFEAAEQPNEAARAYRRVLLDASADHWKSRALLRLALLYEAQGLLIPARDSYQQLIDRYPKAGFSADGLTGTASEIASAALARSPLNRFAARNPRPSVKLPLFRDWHREPASNGTFQPIAAEGIPPSLDASRLFVADGTKIQPVVAKNGKLGWTAELGGSPRWIAYLSDKLVAATDERIIALDLNQGTRLWSYEPAQAVKARRGPDPFAKEEAAAQAGPPSMAKDLLHEFHVVQGRVYCLRGERQLIAIDGEDGQVDWSFLSPSGALDNKFWVGPDRVILQTRKPNQILVMDSEDGHPVSRFPLSESEGLERPPVRFDESHAVIVPDRRTVKLLDLSRGQAVWVYRESAELPVNGPPRIFCEADCLLVLHDGRTLLRLDPRTGAKQWSRLLGTEDLSERSGSIALDHRNFYCVGRQTQTLRAFSLADGSPVWSHHLSGRESTNADWSIALSDRYVMAYPTLSGHPEEEAESLPVVFRSKDSGSLIERLLFSTPISDAVLNLEPDGALISTSSGIWALSDQVRGNP